MKCWTVQQGHPYPEEPIPGERETTPAAAKIIGLVVVAAIVIGFLFSKRREGP